MMPCFQLTYEGLKQNSGVVVYVRAGGLQLTYEGLKLLRDPRLRVFVEGFQPTYEGLKQRDRRT